MARSITLAFAVCFALGTAALADVGPVEIISRTDPTLIPGEGGQESAFPPIPGSRVSADGRFVVFESLAANLAAGQIDTNRTWDVFLHDRETGETLLASGTAEARRRAGNAASGHPTLSADGRFVLFTSFAGDLAAPGDEHPIHAFVYDRVANTTTLVGPTNAAPQRVCCFDPSASAPRISDDGRFVAFQSNADDVIPGQVEVGHFYDLFLFDRENGTTTLVSHAPGLPTTSSGAPAADPSLSADGRFVAFSMDGVHVHDRLTGENSLGYAGSLPEISADGTAVVFVSSEDVLVHDLPTATVSLVSRRNGTTDLPANGASFVPSISADGRRISFLSRATDLVSGVSDLNGEIDVFVFDRDTGSMTLASRASGTPLRTANGRSLFPRISADGRFVAFETRATDLLPGGDANGALEDVFLFDRIAGTTVLVSAAGFSDVFASPNTGNGRSRGPQLSADGGVVAFGSAASNLLRENRELNAVADVYLYDRAARLRTAASVRAPDLPCWTGAGESQVSALSADGRYVAFVSTAGNLVPGQYVNNGTSDVFLRDRATGTTFLVSHQAIFPGDPPSTIEGDGSSYSSALSANGRYVAFTSFATYLTLGQVDTNSTSDVFLYDRHTGVTILLSHAAGSPPQTGNSGSFLPTISANGRYVTYLSFASDLVPGDGSPDSTPDLYLYDRVTGTTKLVSHASGAPTQRANNQTVAAVISANGRTIVFASEATDLVAGVTESTSGRMCSPMKSPRGTSPW